MTEITVVYDGPIVSRDDAKSAGLTRYFTGEPCQKNHIAQRRVSSYVCLECRRLHVSSVKQAPLTEGHVICEGLPTSYSEAKRLGARYYLSKKPCPKGHLSPRYATTSNCTTCTHELSVKIQAADKEQTNARGKAWREANPEAYRQMRSRSWQKGGAKRLRDWRAKNPEMARAYVENRRARRLGAAGSYTPEEYIGVMRLQKYRCAYCRADLRKVGNHADHITPISKGGTNLINNIQACCPKCNMQKHASDPISFAQSTGRLL